MVSKKYWDRKVYDYLKLVEAIEEKESIDLLGTNFTILPGVFSPVHSTDTEWFAKVVIPMVKNKSFLEIGSGSGVIACLAAINGAKKVVATDINKTAVENIQLNALSHELDISIRYGDVFSPISPDETFDIIFWNHPFNYMDPDSKDPNTLTSSVFDIGYESLKKFFFEGKKHLLKNSKLLLGTSSIARINMIKKIAKSAKFHMTLVDKFTVPIFKQNQIAMDLRLYAFSLKE